MATVPLKQVIAELLDSMDRSEHYFRRLYRIGVSGCRQFNMDIYGQFRSVLLDVSANHTVAFPCDYLQYSTLGVIDSCGNVVPLKHNPNLTLLRQQYLVSQQQVVPVPQVPTGLLNGLENPQGFPFYWLNYQWGGAIGWIHLYGVGGGSPIVGEFTIDEPNRCFYVPQSYPYSTVMLEYLSDGFEMGCNDYNVDVFAVEALKWWIRWQNAVDTPKKYGNLWKEYKQEYLIQRREAKVRLNHANIKEMQVVFREHVKLAAKA